MPARSPVGEWQVLHLPAPLKYASPSLELPVIRPLISYMKRFAVAWVRECRKAAISEICSVVKVGNAGMPLSTRPLRITGPRVLPFSSCSTTAERIRSGAPLPAASLPWQKPQLGTKSALPRATASASCGGGPNSDVAEGAASGFSFFDADVACSACAA